MYKRSSSTCKVARSFGVNSTAGRSPTCSWSETTSREISLERCRLQLSGDERVQLAEATADSAAYQAYLKGRFLLNRRRQHDIENAVAFFEEAKASDPDFALASDKVISLLEASFRRHYLRFSPTRFSRPGAPTHASSRSDATRGGT